MPARVNLVGRTFGRLKVISDAPCRRDKNGDSVRYVNCLCACGAEFVVRNASLRSGKTVSCGCYHHEHVAQTSRKHGHTVGGRPSRTYTTWVSMRDRCNNPQNKQFADYGGRGITVCDRWLTFENFLEDMGEKPPGLSIERIDNSLGYCKENCKWETRFNQDRNRRDNRFYTVDGVTACMTDLCKRYGIRIQVVWSRIHRNGWSPERAFTTPVNPSSLHP